MHGAKGNTIIGRRARSRRFIFGKLFKRGSHKAAPGPELERLLVLALDAVDQSLR